MSLTKKTKNYHLWFPNLFEFKGGIQVYSGFFLKALQSLYPLSNYDVFLKHDTRYSASTPFLHYIRYHFTGSWFLPIRTLVFATQIFIFGFCKRPHLVISTHLNFTVAAYLLKCFTGISYWTVAHGVEAWNIERPALKKALYHADKILAVSTYTRDRLIKEQNIDTAKISLLPNTFDSNRFQITPKSQHLLNQYGLKREQPVILTVARLDSSERYKGYDNILRALPEIRSQVANVHYILVGKGNDRPRVEQLVTELHLQECVTLAGFVPDEELCAYYNLCDVFAMPSKGEGFGIVYLEALACGKPTLGGNQDGAIDALCQGELGVLINPDNIAEMASTLIQMLQGTYCHPILYQPELLREKVIDRYGFDRFKQTLAELLQTAEI